LSVSPPIALCFGSNSVIDPVQNLLAYQAKVVFCGFDQSALWVVFKVLLVVFKNNELQASKMALSCPLGTTRRVPQEKISRKPYNKSFIDQTCLVKMA